MKAVVALLVVAFAGAALADKQHDAFVQWAHKHGKKYHSQQEFMNRFGHFKHSLNQIQRLNAANDGANYGLNQFADLGAKEFRAMPCGVDKLSEVSKEKYLNTSDLAADVKNMKAAPTNWDWTEHGAVTPIKNQEQCGSCWAFSTIGNVEGVWKLGGHALTGLSEQQEVDCTKDCYGCSGGWPFLAMKDLLQDSEGKIDTEASYPYTAANGQCSFKANSVGATITGYKSYCTEQTQDCSEDNMVTLLYNKGPLSACLDAGPMQYYSGGIQNPTSCNPSAIDHCITIVGYGETSGTKYWKIKNSWGTGWGEAGYYQLIRGTGACGINKVITIATV
jgi:C1A family cysteine protease